MRRATRTCSKDAQICDMPPEHAVTTPRWSQANDAGTRHKVPPDKKQKWLSSRPTMTLNVLTHTKQSGRGEHRKMQTNIALTCFVEQGTWLWGFENSKALWSSSLHISSLSIKDHIFSYSQHFKKMSRETIFPSFQIHIHGQ